MWETSMVSHLQRARRAATAARASAAGRCGARHARRREPAFQFPNPVTGKEVAWKKH